MSQADAISNPETEGISKANDSTDPASCLDYLKRQEVFLYKMMNDPSHKAMLYFLEVLMNSESALSVEQLASRFYNKSFSAEMRDACGGGSTQALKNFLLKYPSLFTVKPSGLVTAVAIDTPGFDELSEASVDFDRMSNDGLRPKMIAPHPRSKQYSVSSTTDNSRNEQGPKVSAHCKDTSSGRQINSKTDIASSEKCSAVKPIGIYKPPSLRNNSSTKNATFCEMCSLAAHVATTSSTTTVVHCPFAEHNFPHHNDHVQQSSLKHTHSVSHCCCSTTPIIHDPPINHCRHACSSCSSSMNKAVSPCTQKFVSMDNFVIETEAVKFFQQRLSRREERWVPIKSLAGHLSQAPNDVRLIVGPQLEFRRFLLKHPHVFEVQGDLVGLKDSFPSDALPRRPKSLLGALHSSSTTSLSALIKAGTPKVTRPKSLVMLSQAHSSTGSQCLSNRYTNKKAFYYRNDYRSNEELNLIPASSTTRSAAQFLRPTACLSRVPPGVQFNNSFPTPQQIVGASIQHDQVTSSVHQPSSKKWASNGQHQDMNSDTSSSICIRMSANEYRAIMFLRKVLLKNGGAPGQVGLSYVQLMNILSAKAPETVQNVLGWTKVELEEFIIQHPTFFEFREAHPVLESGDIDQIQSVNSEEREQPLTLVNNRRVLKMINIVITGNRARDTETRTLTNRCGKVFHVAKLWGIIDLGKHEHVFFDKSILKYVDDLQKHFKVNEVLYFNAILAAKESRAKWRATQVWKECDKAMMEKFCGPSIVGHAGTKSSKPADLLRTKEQPHRKKKDQVSPESDYGLAGEEEVEDEESGSVSELARFECLNLAKDIKFLSDDIEEEIERLLGPQTTTNNSSSKLLKDDTNLDCQLISYDSDEDTSITGCLEDISINFSNEGSRNHSFCEGNLSNRVSSSTNPAQDKDEGSGERSSSIAVQTLFTGDIMATQIFHDMI